MFNKLRALWQINQDITRHFDLDYVLFDLIFLILYVLVLIKQRRRAALRVGGIC